MKLEVNYASYARMSVVVYTITHPLSPVPALSKDDTYSNLEMNAVNVCGWSRPRSSLALRN